MNDPEPQPTPPPRPSPKAESPSASEPRGDHARENAGAPAPAPSTPDAPAQDAPPAAGEAEGAMRRDAVPTDTAGRDAEGTPERTGERPEGDSPSPPSGGAGEDNVPTPGTETGGEGKGLDLRRSRLAREPGAAEEPDEGGGAEPAAEEVQALRRTVEALLFAADEPLTARELARAAGLRTLALRKVLKAIREAYEAEQRPWELVEVAGGYRLLTRAEFFPAVQKLKAQRAQRKLTPAALETLALVAYSREPIGRAEIEAVRGVDSGPVLRLLLERKLIRIAGRGPGLGQPLLYAVTHEFLTHFGLNSTQELPRPGEFKAP
jgi:segregation and condensation protein B